MTLNNIYSNYEKQNPKYPTDNEYHHRWCEDCEIKYAGVRQCPDCGGTNTGIDELVIRPQKKKRLTP